MAKQKKRNDEFFSLYQSVAKELIHYKNLLKDKVVYCNADQPSSSFVVFLGKMTKEWGIKKVIATGWGYGEHGKKAEITGNPEKQRFIVKESGLFGNGDFRSYECIEILKQCDVVITNPPFSYSKEYIPLLLKYNKQFLIVSLMVSLSYPGIFEYIKERKFGFGFTGAMSFIQENGELLPVNTIGLTNIKHNKINKPLFGRPKLEKYTNYDALNANFIDHIPPDYYGKIGVPTTFLLKWRPDQFRIIEKRKELHVPSQEVELYERIIIQRIKDAT